ncbi:MAG: NAD(+)/NADH kinase [Deltaproteobacteria bacterium]|nr:NAD(+)/NADH kinase [Deltaproteobacteria bacterium]
MKVRRVLLVLKRTAYALLKTRRKRDEARLRRLLSEGHDSTAALKAAHDEHIASVEHVKNVLRWRGIEIRERSDPLERPVRGYDLMITVGGDGTLLEASHFVLSRMPVLGVNSAPAFSVGFLTGCRAPTFAQTLDALMENRLKPITVHRLQVTIGRKKLGEPVLNDVLFCAENPAVTTRYRLTSPQGTEDHRSSGVWVATAAGSTAALRSAGGDPLPLDIDRFAYQVREPYAPPGSTVVLRGGVLHRGQTLTIECRLAEASLYVDGAHRSYPVAFADRVSFGLHSSPILLVRPIERSSQLARGL